VPTKLHRLPPRLHPDAQRLIGDSHFINLVSGAPSPCNIVFPGIFTENINALEEVLRSRLDSYSIYFAHKANQSGAFITAAKKSGIGVDVASLEELKHTLDHGILPDMIEATGPKTQRFLEVLVAHGCLINVDSLDELKTILSMIQNEDTSKQRVYLRLGEIRNMNTHSRFGLSRKDMELAIKLIAKRQSKLDLVGIAFHIDSSELRERAQAISDALDWTKRAVREGLRPTHLNIGGGFRQVFSSDSKAWHTYIDGLKQGLVGTAEPLTWMGTTFGYQVANHSITGIPVFHKYGNTQSATSQLQELLDYNMLEYGNVSLSHVMNDMLLSLVIEPGKATVDGAGITISTVISSKVVGSDRIVTLDIKRDDIVPLDQEVMLDPIIISRHPRTTKQPCGVYFAGTLCLERDMIYQHKTFLEDKPEPGDIVVFANTAAYQMDISASQALMHKRLQKYVAHDSTSWKLLRDSEKERR